VVIPSWNLRRCVDGRSGRRSFNEGMSVGHSETVGLTLNSFLFRKRWRGLGGWKRARAFSTNGTFAFLRRRSLLNGLHGGLGAGGRNNGVDLKNLHLFDRCQEGVALFARFEAAVARNWPIVIVFQSKHDFY
jgi:hypothetical protein